MPGKHKKDTDSIDVAYVANLARIALTEEERATFQAQLAQVVEYVRKIGELDTTDIDPTAHAVAVRNVFREDEVRPGLDRQTALDNAPATIQGQFKVPQIVE